MISDQYMKEIREADKRFGIKLPYHWTCQKHRRTLIDEVDRLNSIIQTQEYVKDDLLSFFHRSKYKQIMLILFNKSPLYKKTNK